MAIDRESAERGNGSRSDPTVLTTEQLLRETASLREIVEAQISGNRLVFEARLAGMDTALQLLQTTTDKQPVLVDGKLGHLRVLHEEKFTSIQVQFTERDVRTEQTAKDSKVAVDAALQAAKEAVGEQNKSNAASIAKQEAAFTKQIDQIVLLITSNNDNTEGKITDLKDRMNRIEGGDAGEKTTKDDSRANMALIISVVIAAVVVLELVMAVFRSLAPALPVR